MNKSILLLCTISCLVWMNGCSTRGVNTQHTSTTYHSVAKTNANNQAQYYHPTMRPYSVNGVTYYPKEVKVGDTLHGIASWYGPDFHGKTTSSQEKYNMWAMTAAHKTLPMNTIVEVTNKSNGKKTIVRINDRGPFVGNRIIDLSKSAAQKIGMIATGTAPVELRVLGFGKKGIHSIPSKEELKHLPQTMSMGGKYALQIGSFAKIKGALYTQEKYNHTDGYMTVIKDMQTNHQRLFKVWLTGFKSEQEARAYKDNEKFQHSFIVRED